MSQVLTPQTETVDTHGASELNVRVYKELTAVPGRQEAWNKLVDVSTYPTVFRRWEWVTTWWKWFGKERELYVVVVQLGREIVGILPLFTDNDRKLRFIGAGGPTCPEYLGPIVHRGYVDPVTDEVVRHLQLTSIQWPLIEFLDVPPDDHCTNVLIERLETTYDTLSWPGVICPYLDLPTSYEALLGRLSPHGRGRQRRKLRKASREFELKVGILDNAAAVAAGFPTIVRLSASSAERRRASSPFSNEDYAGFHQEVIEQLLHERIATVHVLSFDDTPVAFKYGFLYGHSYCSFQDGFDHRFGKYGPGDILLQLVFEDLIKRNVSEFDFLRGEESYKKVYANEERRTRTTHLYRRRGLSYQSRWLRIRVYAPLRRQLRSCWARAPKHAQERIAILTRAVFRRFFCV